MKFLQTENGYACLLTAAEVCGRSPLILSSSEARELSGEPDAVAGYAIRADFESDGARFSVDASPEAFVPAADGSDCRLIEFRRTPAKSPSLYTTVCAAVICRALGLGSVAVKSVCPASKDAREYSVDAEKAAKKTEDLLRAFSFRASFEETRRQTLLPSLSKMKFPYLSVREGQKELIERVYSAVIHSSRLFVSAPTGIGKTVSVLYGTLRAMAGGSFRRIFYLTAKQSTRKEAFAAVSLLAGTLPELRAVVLAPKEQLCPYGRGECDRSGCPLATAKAAAASEALLRKELAAHRGFPSGHIKKTALAAGVCPYDFSLDLSEYCDVIIGDYNSAFDPGVKLRRYFEWTDPSDSVLLIDEAHNLPGRARECFSATVSPDDLLPLAPFAEGNSALLSALDDLSAAFDACRALCSENAVKDEEGLESGWYFSSEMPEAGGLRDAAQALDEALARFSESHRNDPEAAAAVREPSRKVSRWVKTSEVYDSRYRTYIKLDRGRLSLKLFCLDPSDRLDSVLSAVRASVFFSATLTPSDYYADLLGGGSGCEKVSLPSPYPPENLFVGIYAAADTRYEARAANVRRVVTAIAAAVSAKRGNYMVFFPSYGYLKEVCTAFRGKYPSVSVKIQSRNMNPSEKKSFLDFFSDDADALRIGFCVLGGSFSEGIDLPGNRLIGTVIVGVGLPGLSDEGNIIRDYYETRSECGYDYAYTYPGMNAVLQAAGRVIRSDTDRGAVILIDDRYETEKYRAMMPEHWKPQSFSDPAAMIRALGAFWSRADRGLF